MRGCVLSSWGVSGSMGEVLYAFATRDSSLALVGLLLSSSERESSEILQSISFRELISIGGRRSSL